MVARDFFASSKILRWLLRGMGIVGALTGVIVTIITSSELADILGGLVLLLAYSALWVVPYLIKNPQHFSFLPETIAETGLVFSNWTTSGFLLPGHSYSSSG